MGEMVSSARPICHDCTIAAESEWQIATVPPHLVLSALSAWSIIIFTDAHLQQSSSFGGRKKQEMIWHNIYYYMFTHTFRVTCFEILMWTWAQL